MAFQCVSDGIFGHLPENYRVVVAATGQGETIGTEGHASDPIRMNSVISMATHQHVPEGARVRVPQAGKSGPTDTGQEPAIGTEGHVPNPCRIVLQSVPEGA